MTLEELRRAFRVRYGALQAQVNVKTEKRKWEGDDHEHDGTTAGHNGTKALCRH